MPFVCGFASAPHFYPFSGTCRSVETIEKNSRNPLAADLFWLKCGSLDVISSVEMTELKDGRFLT